MMLTRPALAAFVVTTCGAAFLLVACGGKAIVDDPLGQGGSGGAAVTTSTVSTGIEPGCGTTDTCAAACSALYCCAQQPDLCPGIGGVSEVEFRSDCEQLCAESPALTTLVNPMSCAGTVGTIANLWPEFGALCNGMSTGPEPAPGPDGQGQRNP